MRVSVDKTGVEYLLSKCPDQLIRGLKDEYVMKLQLAFLMRILHLFDAVSTHIFQTQSLSFNFFHVVDFAAVAKLRCQHPL